MIAFHDVAHDYGGGPLFRNASMTLEKGSFHFLTGPSGAGKSTFLKLCYGELLPSAGSVSLLGQDMKTMSRDDLARTRQRIGIVHQDCQFLDHLTVEQNVALPLSVTGRAVSAENLSDLLAWVGLGAGPRPAANPVGR